MANVIVAFWSTNGRVMYDAIRDSFLKNGNNVMYLDMFNYISFTHWGESYVINNEDKEYLWKKISQFKPDVVLSFNNIFTHFFVEISQNIYKIPGKNKDRYIFLGFQKTSKELYTDLFGDIKNYFYWPAATTIKNTHSKKLNNISFIGSSFLYLGIIVPNHNYNFVKDKKLFNDIIIAHKSLNGEFCDNFNKLKTLCFPKEQDSYINKIYQYLHSNHISGIERISYLTVLSDLGLKIYGLDLWRELLYFDINLANCFDDTPISTFQDNLKIYNDSKIAVNISHKQATSAFSWSVMDIMASGACLLMEDKPDWRELFEKYLSKETLETVIYKDRFDMR